MLRLAAAVLAAVLSGAPALADDAPWVADTALARSVMSEIGAKGILSVRAHRDDLEAALARAGDVIRQAATATPDHVVLVDGMAQTLIGMAGASIDKTFKGRSVAIANPYPQIAMILGSYYDEIGKPEDAARVMAAGLAADKVMDVPGDLTPELTGERAMALTALKRFDEALASYDGVLGDKDLDPGLHAHLLRGRGFTLAEMGRLDDAEKAYNDSLALEPGNATARNELQYIAKLRAGAAPVAGGMKPLQPATPPGGAQ